MTPVLNQNRKECFHANIWQTWRFSAVSVFFIFGSKSRKSPPLSCPVELGHGFQITHLKIIGQHTCRSPVDVPVFAGFYLVVSMDERPRIV